MTILKVLFAMSLPVAIAAGQEASMKPHGGSMGMSAKLSATAHCPQPTDSHAVEVGDHPGHMYVVEKEACTWTKPMEITGLMSKDDEAAAFTEIDGSKGKDHSSRVLGMDNGDKAYVHTQGTSMSKDQKLESGQGTWSFAGGTGKLKGLKGKGTYKCAPGGDGVDCDIEGEYTLPSK